MARSGHSIHFTSGRHRAHQPQTHKLTNKEIAELKSYLPDWTSTKRSENTAIARAARLFAPKINLGQWKKRKQVMHPGCVENYDFNILFFYQCSDV
jgi:hypothetical protein